MQNLVAERTDDVGLQGIVRLASELVVGLSTGDNFVLQLSSAVGSAECVVADARNVSAVSNRALLEEHLTAGHGSAERVRSIARTSNGVL